MEEAREAYAQAIHQSMKSQMPETMQKLTFEPKSEQQAVYTDEAVIQKKWSQGPHAPNSAHETPGRLEAIS